MEEDVGVVAGGFTFVSATGLLACWWSYKEGLLEFRDVRVWLASHELVARRTGLQKGRVPRFTVDEVARLVGGVGGEHVRASLRRLGQAGLLRWRESSLAFPATLDSLPIGARDFVESIQNHRRKIPFPRRLLRYLSASRRPVLLATALAHVLRCLYYRRGRCAPSGLCKASWIAAVFGVDERNVKAARQELEALGVLVRETTTQIRMNRYGLTMRLNLTWSPPSASRETPPRAALSTTESPRPRETGISSFGRSENQKLGAPNPTGIRKRTGRGPRLADVQVEDLRDTARLLELHREAVRLGYVGNSEAERLKFVAAAEHALSRARKNPAGMFATIIRSGLCFQTLHDEDRARRRLQATPSAHQTPRRNRTPPSCSASPESVRALINRSLRSVGAIR